MVRQTEVQREEYILTDDAYTGGGMFSNGCALFQYSREMDFNSRKEQASYTNLVMPLADSGVDPVFSKQADRIYDSDLLEAFLNDVDNAGNHIQKFVHQVTLYTRLHGNMFVVMDNFKESEIPESLGEVIDERKFPYIYAKKPQDVYEYQVDKWGNLTEISFYYGVDKDGVTLYRGWNNNYSYVYSCDETSDGTVRTVVLKVEHNLGFLPVISWNDVVLPFPPYYSMATIARTIYNVDSELRDLTRSQGFSILVIPGQQPKENVVIGAKNALFVDENASHTPAFISPDSNILNALKEYRKELEESLLQSGDILGATAVSNSSASGVAMSYRFLGTIESLKISSNIATYYENKIVEMFGKLVDQDFEYVVVYDDNYAPSFLEVKEKAGVLEQVYELNINDEINSAIEQDIITLVGGFMEYDEEKLNRLRNSIMDEDSQV